MSMKYIETEEGRFVEINEYKNDEIKKKLEGVLGDFLTEQRLDKTGRKRFGFRLLQQIEDCLGEYGRMGADEFVNLTAEDIDYLWLKFHSLIAYYNRFFEIVPNRQSFMLYARINSRQYKQLMDSKDEDMRSVISFIEDRLVGKGFSASESGNANEKAVMGRLKSADVGHNVVSASEEKAIQAITGKTPLELERKLQQITGGSITEV